MNNEATFGNELREMRVKRNKGLREMSRATKISLAYLSDIENGHRPAPSPELLDRIMDYLELSEEERTLLYNLAAKDANGVTTQIPQDIARYIIGNPTITSALRKAKDNNVPEDHWKLFLEAVENYRKGE